MIDWHPINTLDLDKNVLLYVPKIGIFEGLITEHSESWELPERYRVVETVLDRYGACACDNGDWPTHWADIPNLPFLESENDEMSEQDLEDFMRQEIA